MEGRVVGKKNLPKGFKCGCGKYHEFGVWVMAHWDMELTHTCDNCGRQHGIYQGETHEIRGPTKKGQ
jgi:hypothetical protein